MPLQLNTKKIVIIGGPGTGKSAVIDALSNRGFDCMTEISRQVTLEAQKNGIDQLFLEDPIWFSKQLLDGRTTQFIDSQSYPSEVVFFDRGLPDVVAYLDYIEVPYDEDFVTRCESYQYDMIFILPPWKEIYKQDNERYETFQQTIEIHQFLLKWYTRFGYTPIEVPKSSITERVDFILKSI